MKNRYPIPEGDSCIIPGTPLEGVREILSRITGRDINIFTYPDKSVSFCSGRIIKENDSSYSLGDSYYKLKRKRIDREFADLRSQDPDGRPMEEKLSYVKITFPKDSPNYFILVEGALPQMEKFKNF